MTKSKHLKLSLIIILLIFFITAAVGVSIRLYPRWKAAELTIEQAEKITESQYIVPEGTTVGTRIIPPEGYTRVPAEDGSFGEYMRNYPLLPDNTKLPVYDTTTIDSDFTAAVFDISVGDEGYQQCADSIIRLYSDYFYENGQYDKISFMFSNGDICDYNSWRKGKRMLAYGDYSFMLPAALPDDSEQQYRNYLKEVMRYAGTLSLLKESQPISVDEMHIGDFICNESHVVMIVDEAVNDKGEKVYLFGQSFIPAVCFHIVYNIDGEGSSPWFTQKELEEQSFRIGGFSFSNGDIRRLKDGI